MISRSHSLRSIASFPESSIGGNDLLVAAQAIALGHTVVTDTIREFARVQGLSSENWSDHG